MHLEDFNLFVQFLRSNRMLRRKFTQWSHPLFNAVYLPPPPEVAVPTADFQREIFTLTEDKRVELCVIAGFRESGKSTICTISFPIWAILSGQTHFVVIASQTRSQARTHLGNIKRQLESNHLLKNDFGPFIEESDEWGAYALHSKKYDARIIAISTDQAVRGQLYKHYRPDLIICDDIEDLASTKTQESRDRIYNWFTSEIIPLGSKRTRIFVLGNFLHEFSLVGRLMAQIEARERDGVSKKYALLNEHGESLWPGMYPTKESIAAKKRKIGDEATWEREYQLRLIASTDRLVLAEWLHYYDDLPSRDDETYASTWFSVDLAISKNESADYTVILSAQIHLDSEDNVRVYIRPEMVRGHLDAPEAWSAMQQLLDAEDENTRMFVESNGFQAAYYQYFFREGYTQVEGVKSIADKRTRLALVAPLIKNGTVLFPRHGAQQLIMELLGFGREHHDDCVDALTLLMGQVMETELEERPMRNFLRYVEEHGWPTVDWNRGRLHIANALIDDEPRSAWRDTDSRSGYRNEPCPPPIQRSTGESSSSGTSGGSSGGGRRSGGSLGDMLGGAASRYLGR